MIPMILLIFLQGLSASPGYRFFSGAQECLKCANMPKLLKIKEFYLVLLNANIVLQPIGKKIGRAERTFHNFRQFSRVNDMGFIHGN